MSTITSTRYHYALLFFIALSTIGGFFGWRLYDEKLQNPVDRVLLDEPVTLSEFELLDMNHNVFSLKQLSDKWTFLFFGYTSCPDVCPTTLSEMTTLNNLLSTNSINKRIQFVFISVDPDRDNPDHLKNFIAYFNKDFIAATGTIEQLNKLTRQISIKHRRLKQQGEEYLVEHSAEILLFSPKSKLVAKFPAPHYSNEIADNFNLIVTKLKDTL